MNRKHTVLFALALALSAVVVSCSDDCDDLPVYGTDANITSLSVTASDVTTSAMVRGDSVILITDGFNDLTDATATVTLSEGASISPLPETITDWSIPHDFTVTSANGKVTRTYHYVVLKDAVELSTQEEVNAFGANHPTWAGNIVIQDSEESQITDLSPLASLKKVEYGLTIASCHATEVSLPELVSANSIVIDGSTIESISIPRISRLSNLRLGYSTRLSALKTLNFESLKHIYCDFVLKCASSGTPDFAISGFENLETIDGETVLQFYSANMKAFKSLKSVNHLYMEGTITSFAGLENLKEIRGVFTTSYLRCDASMEGLRPDKVWSINFKGIQTLQNMRVLENVTSMHALILQGGYSVKSLEGLENLRTIEDELYISQLGSITDLNPLSKLEHVGRAITFIYNTKLTDFSGLKLCLRNFNGSWTVRSNGANPTIQEILNQ